MSGQYPSNYNNPLGASHRNQFNQQQQMINPMNQMQMGNLSQNHPMNIGANMQGGGMLPNMTGYNQNTMIQQTQQHAMSGMGVMNPVGMPQQIMPHQQMQMQQQQQQQQQQPQPPPQTTSMGVLSGGNLHQHHHQAAPGPSATSIQMPTQTKEINIVSLSRLGQETVQDIASRFQEIFGALKIIQPTANRDEITVKKVQEHFRTIRLLFKRVRIIYEKCNDGYSQGMEYAHVESLIPYKDEPEHRNEATQCEEYRKALQENQELIETVKLKNRQLREIIDRTRIIIWEINTMLNMRRS
ncbi:mediator of RNA polymerase II transcription subunit 30 [Teleopsis dalmanni]|uniref:mediator of RNA polymerase II transcription subunit 30 n=1 Tax=Teleopsis dalmanni TaxID=139649 RepID=UPI0018CF3EFF|nr:mediator of RNA polymerase II transcription subunit 30 [Teleopsis dalmanni]